MTRLDATKAHIENQLPKQQQISCFIQRFCFPSVFTENNGIFMLLDVRNEIVIIL